MKSYVTRTFLCISLCAVMSMPAWADFEAGFRAHRQGDFVTALREFKADESAQAKFYLSLMYERGDGVPQNREESLKWLRMAAERGLDVAQANLGIMYCEGMGVRRDMAEGMKWLRRAAEQGLPEAQSVLRTAVDKEGNPFCMADSR